jgi:hypothetical protein
MPRPLCTWGWPKPSTSLQTRGFRVALAYASLPGLTLCFVGWFDSKQSWANGMGKRKEPLRRKGGCRENLAPRGESVQNTFTEFHPESVAY